MTSKDDLDMAAAKAALDYALTFQKWAEEQLAEARQNNLAAGLANREKQYSQACDDVAAAQEAYSEALRRAGTPNEAQGRVTGNSQGG